MGFLDILSGIPIIGPAIGAIGGALSNTQGARTSTSTPTIAPGYQSLADLLKQRAMDRLNSSTDLSGYTSNGLANIGQAFNNAQTGLNANLTARGLGTSPVAAAAQTRLGIARAGQNAQFTNTIPLLQRQFQNEDQANALSQVTQLGRGTTGVAPGSVAGGALLGASQALTYGSGQQGQAPFGSAAELLAYLRGKGGIQPINSGPYAPVGMPPFSNPFPTGGGITPGLG